MTLDEVADRVFRVSHAYVSCYVVLDGRDVLLVDAGLPAAWPLVGQTLRELGRRPTDAVGLALTHAHFDHIGFAARAQARLGIPVWGGGADFFIAAHPYRYLHERARAPYPLRHPRAAAVLGAMALAGALHVPGVRDLVPYRPGQRLDAPGEPHVLATPGHTAGHHALHLADRDVLLTGDSLVTFDPYTGDDGPQIVAGAATADSAQALASLDVLAATGAGTLLPGHGHPWADGAERAVALARERGPH